MRLLIYLLALISGFSAAEAARAQVAPSSSVAQTAVAAAEALATVDRVEAKRPADFRPHNLVVSSPLKVLVTVAIDTPVSRNDLLRV
jgi:hypothetical protein